MQGALPQFTLDTTIPPKPLSCVGRFRIDEHGYWVTNEDGIVIVYVDKHKAKWGVEIEKFDGLFVEFICYPNAQVAILALPPQEQKGAAQEEGGDHACK